ncbi:hypothetical protein [[Mycoplasma] cavipharyngis]|uniref:hypothetical protein n=1 Tax=[Mycoplasma] cavipharyngis TaxID=92757 RepID=UPI003703B22F
MNFFSDQIIEYLISKNTYDKTNFNKKNAINSYQKLIEIKSNDFKEKEIRNWRTLLYINDIPNYQLAKENNIIGKILGSSRTNIFFIIKAFKIKNIWVDTLNKNEKNEINIFHFFHNISNLENLINVQAARIFIYDIIKNNNNITAISIDKKRTEILSNLEKLLLFYGTKYLEIFTIDTLLQNDEKLIKNLGRLIFFIGYDQNLLLNCDRLKKYINSIIEIKTKLIAPKNLFFDNQLFNQNKLDTIIYQGLELINLNCESINCNDLLDYVHLRIYNYFIKN